MDAKADFGAIGNGVADDTAALQSALDYLSTNLTADAGVCLYLPPGTYKITDRLTFAATTPDGAKQGITIRGNGSAAPDASIISSTSPSGALVFNINDDAILYNFMVQLQDLQIRAGVADAGAAIEIAKLTGTNIWLRTTPWLRNVEITRENASCYFTYGFKGTGVLRAIFADVNMTGNRPGMTAGILLESHYGYDVSSCFIADADVAIDSKEGGEGNSTAHTTITNVNIGVRMNVDKPVVSSSGGGIINSSISAHQIGVYIDKKNFATFNNSVFSNCGGSGAYTNIYANELRQSIISDNVFAGGTNQCGIVLAEDRLGTDNQNTIAYNQFGPFATSIAIGTNVSLTKIIGNSNTQSNIVDNGIYTYIVHGTLRPFYDSPAAHPVEEDLRWNAMAYPPVISVTDYGATGDGVTDDTTAITDAVAQLKASLDSSGQGTLYFPAGRYRLSKRIDLSQNGANWQKMAICGDGSQVSVIETTKAVGAFKITCTSQVPTRIHNIRLKPLQLNSGTALELIQQNGASNGTRSLIMHDVLISATGNNPYYKTGVIGRGLVRPLFQSVWIDLRDYVGATGMHLTGGYGLDWDGGKMTDVETACAIDSLGGAVTIRGPGFCSGSISTGLTVNAGGGTFALYRAHINAMNNLVVSNASEASYTLSETLWSGLPNNVPSSTLRFSSCTNIYVRDNCLYSAPTTNRPLNTFVMLEGDQNRNVDISGNMFRFYDNEGTGITIPQGTLNVSVYDNRFFTFPAGDIVCDEPTAAISMLPMEYRPELVGYWALDEGANTTAYGRNYLQQGTISGSTWVAGKYGTGLYFDGVNDKVTTATPQFKDIMTNFTMMAWVKPEKAIAGGNRGGGQSYAIWVVDGNTLGPDGSTNHVGVGLSVGTNGVRVVECSIDNGTPDTPTKIDWSGTLSKTAWTHLAVTYSNSVPRLYVNGALVATGTASVGKTPHPGSWGGGAWGWYKGEMDEFRVLDRAVGAGEIGAEAARAVILDFNGSQATTSAFSTAADWDGGVFPAKDLFTHIARFNKTSYANQPTHSNYDLNGLVFGDGATPTADATITITGAGGQQLKLGASGIVMMANAGKATINKIQLGADQSWINNSASILSVGTLGNLDTNIPHTVTLAGSGPINITGIVSDTAETGTTAINVSGATVTLSGANTFSGGITLDSGILTGKANGALGINNIMVADGATLALSGTATNYIGDQMKLTMASSSILNLAFNGADRIGALSLDGGATWLANGTYNAAALGALGIGTYTGGGSLAVAGVASAPAGTPYGWLLQHGLTNYDADAAADADGDGLPSWQEYVAGTDPTNAASCFRITGAELGSGGTVIRWSSVSNRFYDISWSTNLQDVFTVLPGAIHLHATPPENAYTNPPDNRPTSFYRIRACP